MSTLLLVVVDLVGLGLAFGTVRPPWAVPPRSRPEGQQ